MNVKWYKEKYIYVIARKRENSDEALKLSYFQPTHDPYEDHAPSTRQPTEHLLLFGSNRA